MEPSLARFIRRLASFSRLILYDNRGVGLSDPVPGSAAPTISTVRVYGFRARVCDAPE